MKSQSVQKILFAYLIGMSTSYAHETYLPINKKSKEEEIPHKSNELYNQGDISIKLTQGTGHFSTIKGKTQLSVNPNSTITLSFEDNNTLTTYTFIDGKRVEDSRKVITYTGSIQIMTDPLNNGYGYPVIESMIDIIITDYQFSKEAKTLPHLLQVSVIHKSFVDPTDPGSNVNFSYATFTGLPTDKKHGH